MNEVDHNALLRRVVGERLAGLGLKQRGRSRTWLDDHGWWLIVVEFQPSGWAKGTYCNVGTQHLWLAQDHLAFGDHERVVGPSGEFVAYDPQKREQFESDVVSLANSVARVVEDRRTNHGSSEVDALRRLARQSGQIYGDFDAGAAAGLLGWRQDAADAFGRVLSAEEHASWMAGIKEQAQSLAALLDSPQELAAELTRRVASTRRAIGIEHGDAEPLRPYT